MDSAAIVSPRINFSDQNIKYLTLYTYNKEVPYTGLAPVIAPIGLAL